MNTTVIVKLSNGNTITFPLKRAMCGCPRKDDILVFAMDNNTIHARVNKIRWFLDAGMVYVHALELKPEERDL